MAKKPIEGGPGGIHIYLDGTYLKRSWDDEVKNVPILIAMGVAADGYREMRGIAEGGKYRKSQPPP